MTSESVERARHRRVRDDGWRLPDDLWATIEPLRPPRPKHPPGCHKPRAPDHCAMDAIVFVLRTGYRWNALGGTGLCSSSSAHRRFQGWAQAGVFEAFWCEGLLAYDALAGIDWGWPALDGAGGKARLDGEKTGRNPTDRGKRGVPLAAALDGANRNDHKLMRETLEAVPVARPRPTRRHPQHLCLDKGGVIQGSAMPEGMVDGSRRL